MPTQKPARPRKTKTIAKTSVQAQTKVTKIDSSFAAWGETVQAVEKAADQFVRQYKRSGLSAKSVELFVEFWVANSRHSELCDAIMHYSNAIPFPKIVHGPVFPAVVREMSHRRREWPAGAIPAFEEYLKHRPCRVSSGERTAITHVLHRLSKQEDFNFSLYREQILLYGTVKLCRRLIEDDRRRDLERDDYTRLIDRFKDGKVDDHNCHPLEVLAGAKGLPSYVVGRVVKELLGSGLFRGACRVVNKAERNDLLPILEDKALKFTDLHDLREFFKSCPRANKERFREVVRKMLMPDPEDMVDAVLDGSHHHSPHLFYRMMMHGPPPWSICGPGGPGRF